MQYLLAIIGLVMSIAMLKYRQQCGDFIGDADWMHYVVIIFALFLFLWCLSVLTGNTDLLFAPLLYILPGAANPASHSGVVNPNIIQ